jgi:hypothetical protein
MEETPYIQCLSVKSVSSVFYFSSGWVVLRFFSRTSRSNRISSAPMALTPKGDLKHFEFNIPIKPGAGWTIVGAFFKDAGN